MCTPHVNVSLHSLALYILVVEFEAGSLSSGLISAVGSDGLSSLYFCFNSGVVPFSSLLFRELGLLSFLPVILQKLKGAYCDNLWSPSIYFSLFVVIVR